MESERRQKLIKVGAEALADALLELALYSREVDDTIESLMATPKENLQRYKKKIASLKRSRRFIDWRGITSYARELEQLLADLKAGVSDPEEGMDLVASFYEADEGIIGHCDDSHRTVGAIFTYTAKKLFVDYASRCTNKAKVAEVILRISRENKYGVRDVLIASAAACLPENEIRQMIGKLQDLAESVDDDDKYRKRAHLSAVESLARQIKDPELFKETRLASSGKLNNAAFIDIAKVYLDSGDIEEATTWISKVPEGDCFLSTERDRLLLEIYQQKGDTGNAEKLLYQQYQSGPSQKTLASLLDVVGEEKRSEMITSGIKQIHKRKEMKTSAAEFLIAIGKHDEAEIYILDRTDKLNGDFYGPLLELAEAMEFASRNLAASILYRSLLDSILRRAKSTNYHHGVKYLKKLDLLDAGIDDWQKQVNHQSYKAAVQETHGRKSSFWSKYNANSLQ